MRASVSTTATGRSRRDGSMQALDLARGEKEAGEIVAEALLDAGPEDLHRHVAAHAVVDRDGLVHLGDGGGGTGGPNSAKWSSSRPPSASSTARRASGIGERRQLVLQVAQVAGELRADQVGARGEELAELDVAGAETGERAGDAPLAWAGRCETARSGCGSAGSRAGEMQRQRHLGPGRHEAHAVLRQHDAGARQAKDVAEGGGHGAVIMPESRLRHHPIRSAVNGCEAFPRRILVFMHTQVNGGGECAT